jgi:hypothetical protein
VFILTGVIVAAVLAARSSRDRLAAVPGAGLAPGRTAGASTASSPTQRDRGQGAVEITVTLARPGTPEAARYAAGTETVFLVAMDTHSVDLGGYDLVTLSELTAGQRRLAPARWVAASDNNHHRSGALIFPEVDRSADLELRIRDIAAIPVRVFRWAP